MPRRIACDPARKRSRDDFRQSVVLAVAKRSGFQCAICLAGTVGPSAEAPHAVVNVGVAAHIAAASPGGRRYNKAMTPEERSNIKNAVWLCQNDAKAIDADSVEWTTARLHWVKSDHEQTIRATIGVPRKQSLKKGSGLIAQEYAFISVGALGLAYKQVISLMLAECGLSESNELGIMMVGSAKTDAEAISRSPQWTLFVKPDYLRWVVQGENGGFRQHGEVPPDQVYGQIPGWPDTFLEFLAAVVETKATFKWQRTPQGYLILAQV